VAPHCVAPQPTAPHNGMSHRRPWRCTCFLPRPTQGVAHHCATPQPTAPHNEVPRHEDRRDTKMLDPWICSAEGLLLKFVSTLGYFVQIAQEDYRGCSIIYGGEPPRCPASVASVVGYWAVRAVTPLFPLMYGSSGLSWNATLWL
jgi:hypothetical protein